MPRRDTQLNQMCKLCIGGSYCTSLERCREVKVWITISTSQRLEEMLCIPPRTSSTTLALRQLVSGIKITPNMTPHGYGSVHVQMQDLVIGRTAAIAYSIWQSTQHLPRLGRFLRLRHHRPLRHSHALQEVDKSPTNKAVDETPLH